MNALRKLNLLKKTEFVILYGSSSKGKATKLSDVDICISLNLPPSQRLQARMKLLGQLPDKYDIQIFEDLPLYVQRSVFQGKILFTKNKKQIVQRAIKCIYDFEDFQPIYEQYITS